MLEPPDLPEATIADGIASGYNIKAAAIQFLPIGRDPEAWLYKVTATDGTEFFLKVRKSLLNPASLTVPRYLSDQGIVEIVPPIPATDGAFSADISGFVLILFPFIPNATAALDRPTSSRHWALYGKVMRRVHSMPIPAELATEMRRETFASPWIPRLQRVDGVSSGSGDDPLEMEWRALWAELRPRIMALVERSRELGARLSRKSLSFVICHADIHMWNVLIDDGDGLWFVDWDDVMIAPKECDLFFGIGGLGPEHINPEREQWFREGYGETQVDGEALTYYRCERAISDVAANGETFFFDKEAGAVTRRDALEGLRELFLPGRIADLADAPVN